jgi:hypothetical protein
LQVAQHWIAQGSDALDFRDRDMSCCWHWIFVNQAVGFSAQVRARG